MPARRPLRAAIKPPESRNKDHSMTKTLIIGLAAAGSLFAGVAMAGEDHAQTADQSSASAQSSVPAEAVTPSANVVSSTTTTDASGATVTTELVTNGPVPDTPANRARYGQPMSHAGKATAPRGN
jgi:hypothetical protein